MNSVDRHWDFSDPAASAERFEAALETARGDEALELKTQLARAYGMREHYERAHELLDEVDAQLAGAGPAPRARAALERGRGFNSAGDVDRARELFLQAEDISAAAGLEGLLVDAIHMLAITHGGTPLGPENNRRALQIARASKDPKARSLVAAILNNWGWDLYDMGRYDEALPIFEQSKAAWAERGFPRRVEAAQQAIDATLEAQRGEG